MMTAISEWPLVALGDHIDFLTGFPFKSAEYTDSSEDIRLLRGDNIAQGILRWDNAKRLPKAARASYSKFELVKDDVILAMDRPWIEAGLKYAWIRAEDAPCLLVQRVARLRGKSTLLTKFLRYVIGSMEFISHVQSITTGVNVPHISGRDIARFQFRLPPVQFQESVASILSTYDDLIENNTRRIAILEEMARRIFEEWFVHFRAPGCKGLPLVESAIGPIPRGWELKRLNTIIDFDPRVHVPIGINPFVPMTSLSTTSMVVGEVEHRESRSGSGSKFQNGDTLFARITPCLENGKTGFVDFLSQHGIGVGSTEFIVMRGRSAPATFVHLLARNQRFRDHAIKSMSGATGRQRVRRESLEQFEIAVPPDDLLKKFDEATRQMFRLARILADQVQNLRAQRDLLLPKLISGEIDVTAASTSLKEAAE